MRRELQKIGISPQLFKQNRNMVIKTMQDAFGQETEKEPTGPEIEKVPIEPMKKVTQLSWLMSFATRKSGNLLLASLDGRFEDVQQLTATLGY